MNILVTGGAGFIGSHTADALIQKGHRVRILDNLQPTVHPKGRPPYLNPQAEFVAGDVRDKSAWKTALTGIDAIYHLAAYQDYLTDFSTFFHVNAVSTALLYELLVETAGAHRVRKVIVAASQAVMGEGRYRCPACSAAGAGDLYPQIRLETQLACGAWDHSCACCGGTLAWQPSKEAVVNPCNQYALSKQAQEQIAIQLGKRYDIPSVVMRYSIVQGPRQSFYNAYSGAMRIFALCLLADRAPLVFEDGLQIRDYINIEDVVAANLLVLERSEADGQIFNVGGDRAWTVLDFYGAMQRIVGKEIAPDISGNYRFGDTRHIFSDIGRLRALGWQPRRGVEDSIQAYWEYLIGQTERTDALEHAQQQMKTLRVIRRRREMS